MKREEVFRLISEERDYQNAQGKPDQRGLGEWLKSIQYYHDMARAADYLEVAMEEVRKIAALAVAALEQYGCEPRSESLYYPEHSEVELEKPEVESEDLDWAYSIGVYLHNNREDIEQRAREVDSLCIALLRGVNGLPHMLPLTIVEMAMIYALRRGDQWPPPYLGGDSDE